VGWGNDGNFKGLIGCDPDRDRTLTEDKPD
jgi:hypothetical protein